VLRNQPQSSRERPLAPGGYGKIFSDDGIENLRFGRVPVEADESKMAQYFETDRGVMFQVWWNIGIISWATSMPLSA